jgi:hypothetical protein
VSANATSAIPAIGCSSKLSTKLATIDASEGLGSSPSVSDSEDHETKKAPKIQGFDDICRLISSLGITEVMDEIGLDKAAFSLENKHIPEELAQKLARFEIESLWTTQSDRDRLTLFAVAASLAKRSTV